ncbi:hypothetical protein VPNG_01740 [Cytospora leucostoma]|uniref:Uncharacterized protein n=1 Tax=Cytospora leucostoma TaxID=1230097 RepID=A0A423XJW0_9PEZI|nr:hypothetical protein VPNG_01740 [Cytospora leucostoma]
MSSSLQPILARFTLTPSSIASGPHTMTSPSRASPGGPTSLSSSLPSILPLPPAHSPPGRLRVCSSLTLAPFPSMRACSSSLQRMSSSVLFPSSTTHRVSSPGSFSTALSTANIGVMPLPAQIMTNLLKDLSRPPSRHRPRPRYTNFPTGPLNSTQWPSGSELSALVMTPPRGKSPVDPPPHGVRVRVRERRVGADDGLAGGRVAQADHDVLAHGEAEGLGGVVRREGEELGVAVDLGPARQGRLVPGLGGEEGRPLLGLARAGGRRFRLGLEEFLGGCVERADVVEGHHCFGVLAVCFGGSASDSCAFTSSLEICLSTCLLVMTIFSSGLPFVSAVSAPPPGSFSPQNPLARSPPSFFTLSIQPADPKVGCVGCSNRSAVFPPPSTSRCTTTRNQGLFIMPSTLQYISLGCTIIESSMARTITSPVQVFSSSAMRSRKGISSDQKHQQKHRAPEERLPLGRPPVVVLGVPDVGQAPRLAPVQRDLHAGDALPAAGVRVPLHLVALRGTLATTPDDDPLAVRRPRDRAVGVQVVDGIPLVPPRLGHVAALLGADGRRQDPVVVDVIPAIARRGRDDDPLQPLDAPPADLAGYDDPQGLPVVGRERLPVHAVRHEHPAHGVHGPAELDARAVPAVGQGVGALEADVPGAPGPGPGAAGDGTRPGEQLVQGHAGPQGGREARGAPGEAAGLADDVLLLAAVPRAHERDGVRGLLVFGEELAEGGGEGLLDQPLDAEGPVEDLVVVDHGDGAVVPDEVEVLGGDEAFLPEGRQGRLDVEGVDSGEAYQAGVPRHVAVRRLEVLGEDGLGWPCRGWERVLRRLVVGLLGGVGGLAAHLVEICLASCAVAVAIAIAVGGGSIG